VATLKVFYDTMKGVIADMWGMVTKYPKTWFIVAAIIIFLTVWG
jgi:hypothetical protein